MLQILDACMKLFQFHVQFLKISRKIVSLDDVDQLEKLELHGFGNPAKLRGLHLLKSIFKTGAISVSLVTSKSRLAPIKGSTITRLELLRKLLLSIAVTQKVTRQIC